MDMLFGAWKKYAVFKGRASRSEYWGFVLSTLPLGIVVGIISAMLPESATNVVMYLFILALIIPSIAVSVRRLHDTNHSGWYYLLGFIPLIGGLILFVFFVQKGTPGDNQYGPNPLSGTPGMATPPAV